MLQSNMLSPHFGQYQVLFIIAAKATISEEHVNCDSVCLTALYGRQAVGKVGERGLPDTGAQSRSSENADTYKPKDRGSP